MRADDDPAKGSSDDRSARVELVAELLVRAFLRLRRQGLSPALGVGERGPGIDLI